IGMVDHSDELTGTTFNFEPLQDDGSNVDGILTAYEALKLVVIDLTLCNLTKSIGSIVVDSSTPSIPSNPLAQRELAARFTYVDDVTGQKYSFSIPGPQ